MGKLIFDRVYVLTVSSEKSKPYVQFLDGSPSLGISGDNLVGESGSARLVDDVLFETKTIKISDLDIDASVSNGGGSAGSSTGASKITVKNLNRETRGVISKSNSKIVLQAGYRSDIKTDASKDLPILFSGNIRLASTTRRGADLVTELHCEEASKVVRGARVSISIPPAEGATYADVFKRLLSEWKKNDVSVEDRSEYYTTTSSQVIGDASKKPLKSGWNFDGFLSKAMDELIGEFELRWFIHQDILYIRNKNDAPLDSILELPLELIKTVNAMSGDAVSTSVDPDSIQGISGYTFLDGRLKPGFVIRLPKIKFKPGIEGNYRVSTIKHILTTNGNNWDTAFTASRIK